MKPVNFDAVFKSAETAAARGDWEGARRRYGKALKAAPRDWRGYYQAGLLEARAGNYAIAAKALERARGLAGDNLQVIANLAQIYLLTGKPADAVPLLEAVAAAAPETADVQRQLGTAYQALGRLAEAETAYGRAIALGQRDPVVFNNQAVLLQAQGRIPEAIELLESARRRLGNGGDGGVEILNNLANLYTAIGHTGKAVDIYALALRQDPLNVHPHRNLALLYRDLGHAIAADNAAHRAAVADPARVDGLVIAAELLEHRADLDTARRLAGYARVGAPDNVEALCLVARTHRRAGDPAAALEILATAGDPLGDRPGAHKAWFEAAQAEQALGRLDRAFAALVTANRRQLRAMPPGKVDPARAFARVRSLGVMLDDAEPAMLAGPPRERGRGLDHRAPVFLVGFPRSGTTLLDQILDSHPLVRVLEERPLVTGMIGRLKAAGHAYPEALASLDDATLDTLRAGYFADRDRHIDVGADTVFIDKMPLNITDAALIRRVFPDARFLLSVRDPCDVCLSCFMQAFELNDWMAVFTDLDATARLYGAVFDLWFRTAAKLDLDHHVVRYEDLTADLRGTAAAAMRYLGLDWDDRMAAFHVHARQRGHLATPSHAQVTQPVYRHAVNRWRRYGAVMDEAARILEPYRLILGYGASVNETPVDGAAANGE
jgi:tetratricopeptide (TPR) repeat protein